MSNATSQATSMAKAPPAPMVLPVLTGAFAVSVAELTFFARQSGEETSQPVEMYLAVTLLYAVSAFAINRIMGFIEKKSRVPGFVAAGGMSGGH